jgi:hypothetical protein
MLNNLAFIIVLLAGLYLVGLAALCFVNPLRARNFLLGFASSAFAHYIELSLRLLVGSAFIFRAPYMPFAIGFYVFGWVLVITTACLFAVPWKLHHRFAQKSVPHVLRYLKLVAAASLVLGGFVMVSAIYGSAA